jgi:hypothetical protein
MLTNIGINPWLSKVHAGAFLNKYHTNAKKYNQFHALTALTYIWAAIKWQAN